MPHQCTLNVHMNGYTVHCVISLCPIFECNVFLASPTININNTSLEMCYIRQCFKEDFKVLLYFCSQDRDAPNHVKFSHFLQFSFYSVGVFQRKRHAHYPGSLCQMEQTCSYVSASQCCPERRYSWCQTARRRSCPSHHWACICWVSTEDSSGRSEETFAC